MQFNGKDVSEYSAKKRTIEFGNSEIKNSSEWISGSLSPYMDNNQIGFKTLKATIWVEGSSEDEITEQISNLLSDLREVVEISDDSFVRNFRGILKKHSKKVLIENRNTILNLEFSGYEFLTEKNMQYLDTKNITIAIEGNLPTPAIIEITPIEGTQSLTIAGLTEEPIIIYRTNQGKKIMMNGLTGEMTEDGENKAADIEIWELPRLLPGENIITLSYAADVSVRYEARFM